MGPFFVLQTLRYMLNAIERVTYMAERGIGETFLNFMSSKEVIPY